jgi:hypothetical protein
VHILHRDRPTGTATARRRRRWQEPGSLLPPTTSPQRAPPRALVSFARSHDRIRACHTYEIEAPGSGRLQLSERIFWRLYFHKLIPLLDPLRTASFDCQIVGFCPAIYYVFSIFD